MKTLFNKILLVILIVLILYLLVPSPSLPDSLPNSPRSQEPGDLRDPKHFAAYFTNLSRAEIISHYEQEFQHPGLFKSIPSYTIHDYPPEESFTHIADQTRSSYLEEIIYPFRESLFINGYEPGPDDDQIAFEGTPYKSKITIRYYESHILSRLLVLGLSLLAIWWLGKEYKMAWRYLWKKKN